MKKYYINTKTKNQYRIIRELLENSSIFHSLELLYNGGSDSFAMVNSYEELAEYINDETKYISPLGKKKTLIINNSLPIWNRSACESIFELGIQSFLFLSSFELSNKEREDLNKSIKDLDCTEIVPCYGFIPLMRTKNCIKLTNKKCDKTSEFIYIKDRKNVDFPVLCNCKACENIIYNSVPLSIHNTLKNKEKNQLYYLNFTLEEEKNINKVINYYLGLFEGKNMGEFPIKRYTTGHIKKTVK